jgi:hypothetical protein
MARVRTSLFGWQCLALSSLFFPKKITFFASDRARSPEYALRLAKVIGAEIVARKLKQWGASHLRKWQQASLLIF